MSPRLRLDPEQVLRTLEPLERATMLPPPAFTDRAVLDWELHEFFGRGWICAAHVSAVAEPGDGPGAAGAKVAQALAPYLSDKDLGRRVFAVVADVDGRGAPGGVGRPPAAGGPGLQLRIRCRAGAQFR